MTREGDKRLTMPKGFGAFMVNQCAVLWCDRNLWVATTHSHLPCFARKTTPKKRAVKAYKMAMNWAQVTEKKQQAQVYVSTIYFYIYAYISTFYLATLNLIQILLIVRCMQSGIETRGNLSTEFGSPMARSGKSRQKDWKELWILFVFKTIL